MRIVSHTLPILLVAGLWGQTPGVIPGLDYMPPAHLERVDEMVPEAQILDGGIRFRTNQKGDGPLIQSGDRVEAIYTGRLLDGTVFNRKTGRYHTYRFTVGAQPRQIIRGWEMAMPHMQEGGKYTVAIPSLFAYREKGRWGQVPPHATVVFEIEILNVEPSEG
ncbi:MAG: FKBP-type peptidyl-prolyl cis-trans isomerase [Verrucomicrobiota bacterium]